MAFEICCCLLNLSVPVFLVYCDDAIEIHEQRTNFVFHYAFKLITMAFIHRINLFFVIPFFHFNHAQSFSYGFHSNVTVSITSTHRSKGIMSTIFDDRLHLRWLWFKSIGYEGPVNKLIISLLQYNHSVPTIQIARFTFLSVTSTQSKMSWVIFWK